MAVPSPADADAATVRVRLVADMLLQKAQEVQSKGNAGAAQSLADSAADLQRAASLLHELARLVHLPPPRLRSDSDASLSSLASNDGSTVSASTAGSRAPPPASASVKDLVSKLSRVDAMLGKKSDEMKHKGNEGAAHALLQSALAVRLGAQHIAEQQQLTRTLVVTARALREQLRAHCRLVLADEITDETPLDDDLTRRALESLGALAAMRDVVREAAPTAASSLDELRSLLQQQSPAREAQEIERLSEECANAQRLREEAQARHERELRDANDDTEHMRRQCAALEKALQDLEAEYHERRERELEHLNALHERQKGTHEELKKLLLAKEEEVTALKLQADAWMNQFAQQQDTIAELRAQLEEDNRYYDRQVGELRDQLDDRDAELHTLEEELRAVHQQLQDQVHEEKEKLPSSAVAENNDKVIEDLRQQLEAVQGHRDTLLVEREDTLIAMEEAQLLVDTVRNDLSARLEEAERAATTSLKARDERITELEAALAATADQPAETEASVDGQRVGELEEQLNDARRALDEERVRYAKLGHENEEVRAALENAKKECDGYAETIASLRQQLATYVAEESTHTARTFEHEKRLSELEGELVQHRTRVQELETDLQDKIRLISEMEAQIEAAGQAADTNSAEKVVVLQQLEQVQNELAAVREQMAVSQRDLVSIVNAVSAKNDTILTESAPADQVVKALEVRCTRMRDAMKEIQERSDELVANHEEVRAKYLAEHTELRNSICQLEEGKALAEKQYEELKATQLASSEANGIKESETEELTKKLHAMETEFDRYRTRSHAALKKVEKRAELLNSMRKENECLTQKIEELKSALSAAEVKEQTALTRLEDVKEVWRVREQEMVQQIQETTDKLDAAEQRCSTLEAACQDAQQRCDDAIAQVADLQKEKADLAQTKHALHAQALELKDAEVNETKARLEEAQVALAEVEQQVASLEAKLAEREKQIESLENETSCLRNTADQAKSRLLDLERVHEEHISKINTLAVSLAEKEHELSVLVASQDSSSATALVAAAEAEQKKMVDDLAEKEAHDALETELRTQVQAATREAEELTARLMEVQLAKVAAEQVAEQLRSDVSSLKSELATLAAASTSTAVSPSTDEVAALKELLHAKETQIVRLLDEIESVSKRQIEDQRAIAELQDQLSKSKRDLVEVQEQLRIAEEKILVASTPSTAPPAQSETVILAEETIKTLRERVRQLEAVHSIGHNDDTDDEASPRKDSEDVTSLQALRQSKREQYEREMETANRKKAIKDYLTKTADVIRELQESMDEYSSVFRDACAMREEETATNGELNGHTIATSEDISNSSSDLSNLNSSEYEEYLTLKSGVVVKAGSTFSLPVYCDKPGCRVEWKFAVKEDSADVSFALLVETTTSGGTRTRETIVTPARVNQLSGVYDAPAGAPGATAALRFEWDNTFSWLNEKTLDYQVSVLEPLSETKRSMRVKERELKTQVASVDEKLTLLEAEKQRRAQLASALEHFEQCAEEKDAHLARFAHRRTAIQQAKTMLHARMEELKTQLSAFVSELDDMATGEREVSKAWDALSSEHDDVDMTMRLSANSRLDELAETLQSRKKLLESELVKVKTALASSG